MTHTFLHLRIFVIKCLDLFAHIMFSRIPVIGGKELDLHVLYVEVTRRSGYEKVGSLRPYNLCHALQISFQFLGISLYVLVII